MREIDQFFTMEPCTQLNRLVADRVMGMKFVEVEEDCFPGTPGARWCGGSDCYLVDVTYVVPKSIPDDEVHDWLGEHEEAWLEDYSDDIAAAWMVVEKLKSLGFGVEIGTSDKMDYVKIGREDSTDVAEVVNGDIPHLICMAAIRATVVFERCFEQ